MQPIVRPAARYAGPEQDTKLLHRNVQEFERPVDDSPAFSFIGKFKSLAERRKIIRRESLLMKERGYLRRALSQDPIFLCQVLVEPGFSPLAVLSRA
jgi:hypothetical protein